MPMWAPVHESWVRCHPHPSPSPHPNPSPNPRPNPNHNQVWCRAPSCTALLDEVRASAMSTPWEASLQQAAAALVVRKAAMQRRISARAPREAVGWKAVYWLVSHRLLRAGAGESGDSGDGGARERQGPRERGRCCR